MALAEGRPRRMLRAMGSSAANTGLEARLRLVGVSDESEQTPAPSAARRRAVARENRDASTLHPDDVRAVFAARVARALDGGHAAILRPERRRELVAAGVDLGMREFDTHLVIAVVQDAARRGEDSQAPGVQSRVSLVGRPESRASPATLAGIAMGLAAVLTAALIAWLLGV